MTKDGKSGFSYTKAADGKNSKVTASSPPNGEKLAAKIHSHGKYEEDYDNNNFSDKDKRVYDNAGVDGYVATPEGSLKKYDVETKKVTTVSTDLPSDPKDPDRKNKVTPTDIPMEKKQKQIKKEPEKKQN